MEPERSIMMNSVTDTGSPTTLALAHLAKSSAPLPVDPDVPVKSPVVSALVARTPPAPEDPVSSLEPLLPHAMAHASGRRRKGARLVIVAVS